LINNKGPIALEGKALFDSDDPFKGFLNILDARFKPFIQAENSISHAWPNWGKNTVFQTPIVLLETMWFIGE